MLERRRYTVKMDLEVRLPKAVSDEPLDLGNEFEQFANDLDDCLSPLLSLNEKRERILELPRKYHDNALKRLAKLRPAKHRYGSRDVDMDDADGEIDGDPSDSDRINLVEKEAQTWDLLRRLLPLRHQAADAQTNRSRFQTLADKNAASNTLYQFLNTDTDAKERRAVLQWLQNNAASGPEIDELTRELQQNAERGDIIASGWLHTRSAIKLKKGVTGWGQLLDRQSGNISKSHTTKSGDPLVTQLDPDARTRQGRKLEPQDEYFERASWLGCFEHLRRGSDLETLRVWCQERTEMWRAVSLSAMLLSANDDEPSPVVDATALTLWRRMCFGLARQGGSDDYERAVYGVLSGDILSVEKVASTWDDRLFAHYNALLRTQIDQFLLSQCPKDIVSNLTTTFPTVDTVQPDGDSASAVKRLLKTLETQEDQSTFEPHKALQAAIVGKQTHEFLVDQGLALGGSETQPDAGKSLFGTGQESRVQSNRFFKLGEQEGLRVVAHVFALLSVLERLEEEERGLQRRDAALLGPGRRTAQENIVAQYADLLRRGGLQELIPLYCSLLQPPRLYEVLSANLIQEDHLDKRLTQLKLIKRANINVLEFVQTQASFLYDKVTRESDARAFEARDSFVILEKEPPSTRTGRTIKADFFGEDEDAVDCKHDHLIKSLEWLLLVDETWAEVFSAGTRIYKYFLRKLHLELGLECHAFSIADNQLGHMHLRAARCLMQRVPFAEVIKGMGVEEGDEADLDRLEFWTDQLEQKGIEANPETVMAEARTFRELERLVKALDTLETIASIVEISAEYVSPTLVSQVKANRRLMYRAPASNREFWANFGELVKTAKDNMGPLLKNWLVAGIQGKNPCDLILEGYHFRVHTAREANNEPDGDDELEGLRHAYLPETILAYISALHVAGTSLSRDWLLECMELATLITERDSDVLALFVDASRVKELLEAFAASSKTLAIATGEKRATGAGSKKLRELGWSRDLWSIKKA